MAECQNLKNLRLDSNVLVATVNFMQMNLFTKDTRNSTRVFIMMLQTLNCTCPECGKYARQVDITDYNEIFGKQTLFEWLRTLFEPALVRYGRIQKILENLDSKTYASTL